VPDQYADYVTAWSTSYYTKCLINILPDYATARSTSYFTKCLINNLPDSVAA